MIDENLCPFCKSENYCMVKECASKCWCKDEKIPKEMLDLVPKKSQKKACICQKCVKLFKEDKALFINKFIFDQS